MIGSSKYSFDSILILILKRKGGNESFKRLKICDLGTEFIDWDSAVIWLIGLSFYVDDNLLYVHSLMIR